MILFAKLLIIPNELTFLFQTLLLFTVTKIVRFVLIKNGILWITSFGKIGTLAQNTYARKDIWIFQKFLFYGGQSDYGRNYVLIKTNKKKINQNVLWSNSKKIENKRHELILAELYRNWRWNKFEWLFSTILL